jgi:hydrogenase 3 maturation protease
MIVICGIGNKSRGDDAAGLVAASLLAEKLDVASHVFLCGCRPEQYIDVIKEIRPKRIIVIDAAELGTTPGKWKRIEPGEIDDHAISTHTIGISLFHHILTEFCKHVELYVIQVKDVSFSTEISEEVKKGIDELVSRLVMG